MTDSLSETPASDGWNALLSTLRDRYPGQRDSVLFCIHKLQQNPDLTLRDFREEAALLGIPTAGRALHSARQMLGLTPSDRTERTEPAGPAAADGEQRRQRRQARRAGTAGEAGSIESKVLDAVRQIQNVAEADSRHLRAAMREAIATLQRALDA